MKVTYDSVTSEYLYPLSKSDITSIRDLVSQDIWARIRSIRFGCNTKTTQEGRVVQHGRFYDIRINLCLNNFRSTLLSDKLSYINQISHFGGVVDTNKHIVSWRLNDAKRYSLFLLLHEIGHILFSANFTSSRRGLDSEEQWCDNYAVERLKQFKDLCKTLDS